MERLCYRSQSTLTGVHGPGEVTAIRCKKNRMYGLVLAYSDVRLRHNTGLRPDPHLVVTRATTFPSVQHHHKRNHLEINRIWLVQIKQLIPQREIVPSLKYM